MFNFKEAIIHAPQDMGNKCIDKMEAIPLHTCINMYYDCICDSKPGADCNSVQTRFEEVLCAELE